jgi:hypothetical protein
MLTVAGAFEDWRAQAGVLFPAHGPIKMVANKPMCPCGSTKVMIRQDSTIVCEKCYRTIEAEPAKGDCPEHCKGEK